MKRVVGAVLLLVLTVLAGCLGSGGDEVEPAALSPDWLQDAVVIAVVDFGFNPYHVEWDAALHPANLDGDPATDFAFDRAPHEYLSHFPAPDSFASYAPLYPTRATHAEAEVEDLLEADETLWGNFSASTPDAVAFHWLPGTKVIGLLSFATRDKPSPAGTSNTHGARVASVTAGSIYGACPECLLVFIEHGPGALEWANSQDWIDVVTNSYGSSGAVVRAAGTAVYPSLPAPANDVWLRTHIYNGDDGRGAQAATERGQTTVFSAGNGARNSYNIPTTPFTSSQRGPDWILRVGAIYHDTQNSPMGVGKPVDVASIGTGYPSQGGPTVNSTGTFSGTSNAAPVTAGMLARTLFFARQAMEGPSRIQADGVVAVGAATCGAARSDCELGDGVLTRTELVDRFLQSAEPVVKAWAPRATLVCTPDPLPPQCAWGEVPVATEEMRMLVEGHGTFFGRYLGDAHHEMETWRVVDQLTGDAPLVARPAGEEEWFQTISYCNQMFWGEWDQGWWRSGESLPAADAMWPARTAFTQGCDEAAMAFHAYLDLANAG